MDYREVVEAEQQTERFADAAQDESLSDLDRSIFASLAVANAVVALGVRLDYLSHKHTSDAFPRVAARS